MTWSGYDPGDFMGKSVLALGPNVGLLTIWAAECGATSVLCVDHDAKAVRNAMRMRDRQGRWSLHYKVDELDNPLFWSHIESHDTVLLSSDNDPMKRLGVLSRAAMKCKGVLYADGYSFANVLDYADCTQIESRGCTEGRHVFRCSRKVLNAEEFYAVLDSVCQRYGRIGVLGNQLAGKSTLAKGLRKDGFVVLDDCDDREYIASCGKCILFDYRAALYANDWDVVFNVLQPPAKFECIRKNARYLPSSALPVTDTMQCLYTVRTH